MWVYWRRGFGGLDSLTADVGVKWVSPVVLVLKLSARHSI